MKLEDMLGRPMETHLDRAPRTADVTCWSHEELVARSSEDNALIRAELARRLALVHDVTITEVVTHCPRCGLVHLDLGEWYDRPHRKHLCAACGHLWTCETPGPTRGVVAHDGSRDQIVAVVNAHALALQVGARESLEWYKRETRKRVVRYVCDRDTRDVSDARIQGDAERVAEELVP